jgi:hypothetical protein
MSESESGREALQDELNELMHAYRAELARRGRIAELVAQVLRAASRDDFLQLDELLASKTAAEAEADPELASLEGPFDRLRAEAAAKVERYRLDFIEDLSSRAAEAGLPLEIDFPRLRSLRGIEGHIDFAARTTTINKKRLKSIDPRRIITLLGRIKRELYDRPFEAKAFVDGLHEAYINVLELEGRKAGQSVPAGSLYLEYVLAQQSKAFFTDMDKGKFRGYPLDQFAVDLWRFFQSGTGGTSKGAQLRLDPGRGGLWLIDHEGERRQITGITFLGGKK